jgi:NADH-quinone oxidoreductase subunit L
MHSFIYFFISLPFIGFIISLFLPGNRENLVSKSAIYTVGLHLVSFVGFTIYWICHGHPTIDFKNLVLFNRVRIFY